MLFPAKFVLPGGMYWRSIVNFLLKALTSRRALLSVFCFAICALLASSFWLLLDLRDGDLRQARAQLHGLGKIMGTQTRNALDGVSLSLRSAQERLSDPLGQRIELESPLINFLLKARIAGLPQIRSLFVLNDEGLLANSSLVDVDGRQSFADRSYFRFFADGGNAPTFLSEPIRNRIDGEWSLFLSTPLLDERKRLRGVLVASISLKPKNLAMLVDLHIKLTHLR